MMEPADNMSPEALRSRVLQLEAALEEQEHNVIKAAMFGKSLLEENGDLQSRIDDLMKQHAADLEVQANYNRLLLYITKYNN